ncbi:hypothetical protein [Streptomyces sparsogenes]|uniref:hypothetical protein n=1 Tax=Streptomyces sparsogenes TaxID=67365 RepID=UPI001FDF04DB|nr:hypothetical protein [Streptomyces sparsogenes]
MTFLTACGVSQAEQRPYIGAYQRIIADRAMRPAPPHARRTIRHPHPVPLAQGGTDTRYELTAGPATSTARPLPMAKFNEALLQALAQAVSEEAHRNGTAAPNLVTATSLVDHGVDLTAHTTDGSTLVFELKSYQQHRSYQHRPEPRPELGTRPRPELGTRIPPPPRPAPAARSA